MKSVIIVDDELLARLGIKSLISWEDFGYEIVGEAENGQQALDLSRQLSPDILICDMKMPVMDGNTLILKLKELPVIPQIIAVSAYDEFCYVKQALKEGACDYLLKSELEPSTLLQALENASSRLTETSLQNHSFTPGHLKVLQQDFLENLFSGKSLPDSYIRDQQKLLHIQLPVEFYFCLSLKIIVPESSAIRLAELKETVEEVISNTLNNYSLNQLLLLQPDHALILLEPLRELQSLSNKEFLMTCGNSLSQMITMLFNCTCHIGASQVCHSILELPSAREQALDAMEKALFSKELLLVYSSHYAGSHTEFSRTLEHELKNIEVSLCTLDTLSLRKNFEALIHKIHLLDATDQKYLRGICHTLIFIVNQHILSQSMDADKIWNFDLTPYETVSSFEIRWQYCRWIQHLSNTLQQILNPENEHQRIIIDAKKYIQTHYSSNLSLDFMANYLGLSPNYFSKIFKKYTGIGFVDYLTDLRLRKAEELLRNGKYKIYEISYMIGYENPTYFSRIFKKKMGYSPYQIKTDVTTDKV